MKIRRRLPGFYRVAQITALAFLVIVILIGTSQTTYAKRDFVLVYYDGHMHTTRSDGSGSVADIKATALSRGLNVVIITDHCDSLTQGEWTSLVDEAADASDANFLVLPGFEVTGSDGMLNRDHINALGAGDPFVGDDDLELCPDEVWESPLNPAGTGPVYPEHLAKWVDYIHSQGGIAVHNHPSGSTILGYGVNQIEVYNQGHVDDITYYASQLGYPPTQAWEFGILINNLAITGEVDALHMLLPNPGFPGPAMMPFRDLLWWATLSFSGVGQWLGAPEAPLNSWDELLMAYVDGTVDTPTFGVANSDAHNTGESDSNVGVAKNGVYVKEFTEAEFYKALKAGRSFATTGPSLDFDVNGEHMGDTAYVPDGKARLKLSVVSESPTAVLVKIDIIKNGEIWQTLNPMTPTYQTTLSDKSVTAAGYYRVEVTSYDVVSGNYYFAWSNPVFVSIP
jgi:hypothetical protein